MKLKTPSLQVIRNSLKAEPDTGVRNLNKDLKRKGYAPITAKRRDEVIKQSTVKRAQPNKKKAPVKKAAMKKGADITKKAAPKKKLENNQVRKKTRTGTYGGARKNSGRKVGAATKKTREIADKLAESSDITPLSYMLEVLNTTPDHLKKQYDAGDLDTVQYATALQDLTRRRDAAAKDSAVYLHPRLSSIEANVGLRGQDRFVDLMLEMDKDGSAS